MARIISVVGARPNYMKVAPLHRVLKQYDDLVEHLICHTGQHYDYQMYQAFFEDLELPPPDFFLGVGQGTHGEQTGKILIEFEKVCMEAKPDIVIVVGDVNSTVAATLAAKKLRILTAHIEAGLRSFDPTMPEEINRIVTDSICDYLFVTERSGIDNLINEGHHPDKIFFVGNTMIDSLIYALPKIEKSNILKTLNLQPSNYAVMTLHRPSNVDYPDNLSEIISIIEYICYNQSLPLVFPIHPRTRKNIESFGFEKRINSIHNLIIIEPQSYINFIALMKSARFVLTDSGGIQEETTFLQIPCITMRTTTERPITQSIGTNILIPPDKDRITKAINDILHKPPSNTGIPPLWDGKASERIAETLIKVCNVINFVKSRYE